MLLLKMMIKSVKNRFLILLDDVHIEEVIKKGFSGGKNIFKSDFLNPQELAKNRDAFYVIWTLWII